MILTIQRSVLGLIGTMLIFSFQGFAQDVSNVGRDFWAVFPSHVPTGKDKLAKMKLFITSTKHTKGEIKIGGIKYKNFKVEATKITEVDIPYNMANLGDITTQSDTKGIQILVDDADPPIVAYAHIYANARSEATLLLPVESYGSAYYAMGWKPTRGTDARFVFNVVAITETTTVNIHMRIDNRPGPIEKVVLNQIGQVYQFVGEAGKDYTGTYIEADPITSLCKTFALFSGDNLVYIPEGADTGDPLLQQLYATNYWGKTYAYVPFKGPDKGNYLRIIAMADGTEVTIGNRPKIDLNKGEFYTSDLLTTTEIIQANKPISVAQFALSQGYADSKNSGAFRYSEPSDPDMVMLNPIESKTKNITVFSSTKENIKKRFINIILEGKDASTFKIGGIPVPTANATFTPIGTSGYSYMQLNVGEPPYRNQSSLNLTAQGGFNAICYGFGDFESYGYSAGTHLSTDVSLDVIDLVTGADVPVVCKDRAFRFKLSLNFPSTEVYCDWGMGGASRTYTLTKDDYISVAKNGKTYYICTLPEDIVYGTSGSQKIKIKVKLPPSEDQCAPPSGYKYFEQDIQVQDPPKAKFKVVSEACVHQEVAFTNESMGADGSPIKECFWDFGDTYTSTDKNPKHTYDATGPYTVRLAVKSSQGCSSFVEQVVRVLAEPRASFTCNTPVCQNSLAEFIDTSVSADGLITHWDWNFGDGHTSSDQFPTHRYVNVGTYTVRLTVETDKGCKSPVFTENIVVKPFPQVDFKFPEGLCLKDPTLTVPFSNETIISGGNRAEFTYLWDFGDPGSGEANESGQENPSHDYSKPGNYTVKLTVTHDGCTQQAEHSVLIHAKPKPDFGVLNENQLCSSEPVVFEDKTFSSFGEISRIDWYFDDVHYPAVRVEDHKPHLRSDPPKQYVHTYPVFYAPLTKTVTVKMVAYTADFCVGEVTKTVELRAVPDVIFDAISSICVDAVPTSLVAYVSGAVTGSAVSSLTGSVTGTGQFSGKGVSIQGVFNPAVAGVGTHTLTYTFTGANSCSVVKTQMITVHPLPKVNAGGDRVILQGEHIRLEATAHGDHLAYKWTPATDLDHDNILHPIASPHRNITYTLLVTSKEGCTSKDDIFIKVLPEIEVPSVFTPNGDGINDVWVIKNLDLYEGAIVDIFNRYGDVVFHSEGHYIPWDGKMKNGEILPVGAYHYIINPKHRRKIISGTVSIIR